MRLNVHDFSGHPFQVQLSRELAAGGHHVLHGYSSQFVTGRGRLAVDAADPATLRIALDPSLPARNWSVGLDFTIILLTVWPSVCSRGAF